MEYPVRLEHPEKVPTKQAAKRPRTNSFRIILRVLVIVFVSVGNFIP
jgi:hypothetical protein